MLDPAEVLIKVLAALGSMTVHVRVEMHQRQGRNGTFQQCVIMIGGMGGLDIGKKCTAFHSPVRATVSPGNICN